MSQDVTREVVATLLTLADPRQRWRRFVALVGRDKFTFDDVCTIWNSLGHGAPTPFPVWFPTERDRATNLAAFMTAHGRASWDELYRWSVDHPGEFWAAAIQRAGIVFATPPSQTVGLSAGVAAPRWLPDSRLNIVESCFSAPANSAAVIVGSANGSLKTRSVSQLRADVMKVVSSLQAAGFQPEDAVAVMMPMTYESVVIYLGLVAAGCTVVSIADSFAAPEIEKRLRIAKAKAIFCMHAAQRAGRTIEIWNRVREAAPPRAIVLNCPGPHLLRDHDLDWEDFLRLTSVVPPQVVHTSSMHTINVLFSSGTTGDPKAIPWNQTTPIKCAVDGHFHHDIQPGDVVAWPTNLGWMMGPWLIFASLINRATIALFDDAPHTEEFGKFVERAGVTMLGVVPTLVRAWRETHCMEGCDWSAIRCFSSTGEASRAEDMTYLSWLAGWKPIVEYCGGTEIGGGYITSTLLHANVPSTFSTPALGSRIVILDEQFQAVDQGELFLVPPALGLSVSLWNRDHGETYYAGLPPGPRGEVLRRHGDHFSRIATSFGEYYVAGGRVDDTMNLGGIKISSAEIEQALNTMEGISETAAIAVATAGPDQLVVYVVLQPAAAVKLGDKEQLRSALNHVLRTRLNPLFKISDVVIVDKLPRTASNKVMRRELRREFQTGAGVKP